MPDNTPTFKVPFLFSNKFNSKVNRSLIEIYRGSSDAVDFAYYDRYKVNEVTLTNKDGKKFKVGRYNVYFNHKDRSLDKFHFGWIHLKEYVTHILQTKFFPDIEHPDIPYIVVRKIMAKECPLFGDDPMLLVALCDACLMDIHPARTFFRTVDRIRKGDFRPNSTKAVYDFVYSDLEFGYGKKKYSIREAYDRANTYTRTQIGDAMSSDIFQPNREWVEYILNQAAELRFGQPTFMTELVEGPGRLTDTFFEIFRKLGTPFFSDAKFNGGIILPDKKSFGDVQAYQLLVFQQILNIYWGVRSCGLHEFCKKREGITNEHCTTAPWLRGLENDLCPLGQVWKTWGLNGKVPVK
jgi:hypothetical protein